MTSFQGIKDTTKDILEKKKIEKIKFGEAISSKEETINDEHLTAKTLKHENNKTTKSVTTKNISTHNIKTSERRKASKNQITAYLLDNELDMLEEIYFLGARKKLKPINLP